MLDLSRHVAIHVAEIVMMIVMMTWKVIMMIVMMTFHDTHSFSVKFPPPTNQQHISCAYAEHSHSTP